MSMSVSIFRPIGSGLRNTVSLARLRECGNYTHSVVVSTSTSYLGRFSLFIPTVPRGTTWFSRVVLGECIGSNRRVASKTKFRSIEVEGGFAGLPYGIFLFRFPVKGDFGELLLSRNILVILHIPRSYVKITSQYFCTNFLPHVDFFIKLYVYLKGRVGWCDLFTSVCANLEGALFFQCTKKQEL